MAKKKKSDEELDGEESGGKSKKKLLFVVGPLLLVAVAYKFVLAPSPAANAEETGEDTVTELEEGEVAPIPELVLNLADPEPRYLRVGLALVLEKGTTADSIQSELALASDAAIDYLSSKTYAELAAPSAKLMVKDELSVLVREAYGGEKVVRVIFTSFVMQ